MLLIFFVFCFVFFFGGDACITISYLFEIILLTVYCGFVLYLSSFQSIFICKKNLSIVQWFTG